MDALLPIYLWNLEASLLYDIPINAMVGGLKYIVKTSFPYFGVKLICVCLVFAYRKKIASSYPKVTNSYPRVTYSDPKMTYSDPTHLPLPPPTSPEPDLIRRLVE